MRLPSGVFSDVQRLQHHWDVSDAERMTTFAQMAVLTRWLLTGSDAEHCRSAA